MKKVKNIIKLSVSLLVSLAILFSGVLPTIHVKAADNNFTDGITVDSTGDGADANLADSICDDGSGNCTLRAAIQESNDEAGTQTIEFNIAGSGVHTIQPSTALPDITGTVIIDGYSQPGSQPNTAVAPNPLNGTLLIEIDGSNAGGAGGLSLTNNSDGSIIKGLTINDFGSNDAIKVLADNIIIQGNYIGTNPAGTFPHPNTVGINGHTQLPESGQNTLVGGLQPEQRNLISGNTSGGAATATYPGSGWTFLGNYIGLAADGVTPIANSTNGGSGAISIDDCHDVTIGGSQTGAMNVIGESLGHGIAPSTVVSLVSNVLIEGNYIGLSYDGTTVLGNVSAGAVGGGVTSDGVNGLTVKNNRIAGWKYDGIYTATTNTNVNIDGNTVTNNSQDGINVSAADTTITNNNVDNNSQSGINVSAADNILVNNSIIGSGTDGIHITGSSNLLESNTITDNDGIGVDLQTSSNTVTGNVISNNHGAANVSITAPSGAAQKNVITNNKIGTKPDGSLDPGYTQHVGVAISGNVSETLVGGSNPGDRNTIAGNSGGGIIITELVMTGFGTFTPSNNTILGNTIHSNDPGTILGLSAPGSGIDLLSTTLSGFVLQSAENEGLNPNDATDVDTGANGYINFPVLSSFAQSGTSAIVNYSLDAADSPGNQYRVEFFANDTADPSGYGEGQTYLGAVTTAPGNNLTATFTLPTGTDLTGKQISSTTTAIDNTTTSGFGSTSEFSGVVLAAVTPLAKTGQNSNLLMLIAGSLVMGGLALLVLSVRKNHGKR